MTRTYWSMIITLLCSLTLQAQDEWATNWSARLSLSSSYFLCDLGGKDAVGTNDFSDLNLEQTRYAIGLGLQYHIGGLSFGANAFKARLAADDKLTNAGRSKRRLQVITDVYEASVNMEYVIPTEASIFRHFYFNMGIGLMYFNPTAQYQGKTYNLQPLGTEGQLYLAGRAPYKRISPVIPFGFGYKIFFNNGSNLSIDLSLRKSFTDYLDDVSTQYADPALVAEYGGEIAGILSDRSHKGFKLGENRGDQSDNDQYFLFGFRYEFPFRMSKSYHMNKGCTFGGNMDYPIKPNYRSRYKRRFKLFR